MILPSITHWFVQNPWMLLALFSLLVPLIIHLLSKSKGKLVPFGNIKLIQLSKPVKMNEIRLVERLLLLCRLLMLFFSVLLLAQLYYDDKGNGDGAIEGNILVTNDWLNHATEAEIKALALKAKSVPTYLLLREVERLTDEKIATWQSVETNNVKGINKQNTWLLVNNYAKKLPNNVNISVYSTNRLSQFMGDKIYLPDNIVWEIKRLPEDKLTDLVDTLTNKMLSVIVISDDDNNEYLPALKAALSIIQVSKLEKLTFTFQHSDQLKDEQLQGVLPQGNNIEKYDSIIYLGSLPISTVIKQRVREGTTLIADIKHAKESDVTHFVDWRELVSKVTFPATLMSLLLDESITDYQLQQQLSDEQISQQLSNDKSIISTPLSYRERSIEHDAETFKNDSINQLLILLLAIFWSMERLLSERFKKNQVPSDHSFSHKLRGNSHDR